MDRLTDDGWLRLKTIAIPSSPMIVLLKSIAIPLLTPMVMFEPFIQWQWFLIFLLKKYISGQGLFPYMVEYTFIVQYQKQNKQRKSKLFQMNTGSSKAPTVEMWSWLSRERRVSQRGSPPLVYQIIREMATMRRLIIMRWMSKAKIMMRMIVLRTWCTG